MTNGKNESGVSPTADREISVSRVLDAPRELVWQAMVDPKHVVQWWGPRGFSTTIAEMDVRPGGKWNHVMHGPDGTDFPNYSTFTEIVKPERIVYTHGGGKAGGPEISFIATWTFESLSGGTQTRLTMRSVFPTAAERDTVVKLYGALEGGKQCMGRLAEHLPRMDAASSDFVITRQIAAPRELVFKAWTEPRHMAQWWGPHQFTNPVCEMDVRPGGKFRIVMRGPDGTDHPAHGEYREVTPPEKIVMTINHSELPEQWHDMVNPNRDKTKPRPGLEALTTVTFDEDDGATRLTVRVRFETPQLTAAFLKIGMTEGWSQSLERLATEAAKMAK